MATKRVPARGRRGRDDQALQEVLNPTKPVLPFPPGLPEEQKEIWRETVNCKTADFWSRGDVPLLQLYCRAYCDIQRLDTQIAEEGEVIRNAKGNQVVNPKLVVRGFAEARLMALATKLRLQPSSRLSQNTTSKDQARKQSAAATAQAMQDGDEEGDGLLAGSVH